MNGRISRKVFVFGIMLLFFGASIVVPNSKQIHMSTKNFGEMTPNQNYSHTVFVGIGTSQNCEPCDPWNQHIHEAYVSGEYDFEYVEMIEFDHEGKVLNQKAQEWAESYGIGGYPTSISDGDYQRIIGNYPGKLPDVLDECGSREVVDITANITLSWLGNATIQVNITIQNNESIQYNGHIRAFITEIVSRYDTFGGDPYHFGFLDYAFDKDIFIDAGEEYVNSAVWNGNEHEDKHGNDFGDITKNNTQVTLVIYNSDDGYVDETVIDRIANSPPNMPTIDGPTSGNPGTSYDYDFTATDPDLDDIEEYIVNWGDGNEETITGPFASGSSGTASHTWTEEWDYIITAKAKDINGLVGPEGTLEVSIPKNKPFNFNFPLLNWLFERFPNAFPILRHMLGL